jgi:hypothetical protein
MQQTCAANAKLRFNNSTILYDDLPVIGAKHLLHDKRSNHDGKESII